MTEWWKLRVGARKVGRRFKTILWLLHNAPLTDEERLALRWAKRHIEEGRPDLAEEDLLWVASRG